MSFTVKKVLEAAAKEIGYVEGKNNQTKFGVWYGMNNVAWCYIFVSYILAHAGSTLAKCAYCPTGFEYFKKQGKLFKEGKPGDLVFYNFSGGKIPEHIGFYEKGINASSFWAIEGNTSSDDKGSQASGGGVYRRKRYTKHVLGFGRPDYENEGKYPKDITGRWSEEAIKKVIDKGIMKGLTSEKFSPEGVVTREQLATVVCKILGL